MHSSGVFFKESSKTLLSNIHYYMYYICAVYNCLYNIGQEGTHKHVYTSLKRPHGDDPYH